MSYENPQRLGQCVPFGNQSSQSFPNCKPQFNYYTGSGKQFVYTAEDGKQYTYNPETGISQNMDGSRTWKYDQNTKTWSERDRVSGAYKPWNWSMEKGFNNPQVGPSPGVVKPPIGNGAVNSNGVEKPNDKKANNSPTPPNLLPKAGDKSATPPDLKPQSYLIDTTKSPAKSYDRIDQKGTTGPAGQKSWAEIKTKNGGVFKQNAGVMFFRGGDSPFSQTVDNKVPDSMAGISDVKVGWGYNKVSLSGNFNQFNVSDHSKTRETYVDLTGVKGQVDPTAPGIPSGVSLQGKKGHIKMNDVIPGTIIKLGQGGNHVIEFEKPLNQYRAWNIGTVPSRGLDGKTVTQHQFGFVNTPDDGKQQYYARIQQEAGSTLTFRFAGRDYTSEQMLREVQPPKRTGLSGAGRLASTSEQPEQPVAAATSINSSNEAQIQQPAEQVTSETTPRLARDNNSSEQEAVLS